MPAINTDAVMKQLHNEILNKIEVSVFKYGYNLLERAIHYRNRIPDAHDFTGNFLNSIVVSIYRNNEPRIAYYPQDLNIKKAMYKKMSYRKKKSYRFSPDYQGSYSRYKPEEVTNKGWGIDDAMNFVARYRPNSGSAFDIVVCYPVEYANFIEEERKTTGITSTYLYAKRATLHYLKMN